MATVIDTSLEISHRASTVRQYVTNKTRHIEERALSNCGSTPTQTRRSIKCALTQCGPMDPFDSTLLRSKFRSPHKFIVVLESSGLEPVAGADGRRTRVRNVEPSHREILPSGNYRHIVKCNRHCAPQIASLLSLSNLRPQ